MTWSKMKKICAKDIIIKFDMNLEWNSHKEMLRRRLASDMHHTLDINLKRNSHIEMLCRRLASGIYFIKRINKICGTVAIKIAFFSLLAPHLRHGIEALGGTSDISIEREYFCNERRQ